MTLENQLYHWGPSSSSWRVRIALDCKKAPYESILVDLDKGEQNTAEYRQINSSGLVPALVTVKGETITESLAIVLWLDKNYPNPSLLAEFGHDYAHALELSSIIASQIQPLQNSGALKHLSRYTVSAEQFARERIEMGLAAYERILERLGSKEFSLNTLSIADIFLIPQAYNASQRFGIDLSNFPRINQIYAHCLQLEPFQTSHPDRHTKAF